MIKIIDTPLQNNSHYDSYLERSVNYFENFRVECHLLKIRYNEFSFTKYRGCQCNLPFFFFNFYKYDIINEFLVSPRRQNPGSVPDLKPSTPCYFLPCFLLDLSKKKISGSVKKILGLHHFYL